MEDKEYRLLQKFGARVRLRRYELKLSQLQLAEKANCGLSAIGRIERAEVDVSFSMILKISRALQIHPKDLFPEEKI